MLRLKECFANVQSHFSKHSFKYDAARLKKLTEFPIQQKKENPVLRIGAPIPEPLEYTIRITNFL